MSEESWRDVVGFEGLYQVSDQGRVRSLGRMITAKTGVQRRIEERILRPGRAKSGHMLVVLQTGNCRFVHRLVLEAFVGPRPIGKEACHADDTPSNNNLCNLRWGTRSDNIHDAVRNGRARVAERHRFAKLSNEDVVTIRASAGKVQQRSLAHQYGVGETVISNIINRKTWKSVA